MTLNINIKFSSQIEEFDGDMQTEIENKVNSTIFAGAKVYERPRTDNQITIKTSINSLKISDINRVKKNCSSFFGKQVDFVQVSDT